MKTIKVINNFKLINIKPVKTLKKRLKSYEGKGYKVAHTNFKYDDCGVCGGRILLEKNN